MNTDFDQIINGLNNGIVKLTEMRDELIKLANKPEDEITEDELLLLYGRVMGMMDGIK
jgi:hypothetical protein